MRTGYGFTEFESISEFKTWLNKQSKYNYTGLQVHHTYSPNYSCFYKSNGSTEDCLVRQYNMKYFHVHTNGWGDIAQHFTIFPNGHIVTGRKLSNTTAIGIKGWNSNKICCEIYGDFDKGKDTMNAIQKETVIAFYALLCKKFGLTPSTSTVRPHCWFTAGGTYLGDYNSSKSAKTCPGTNFMGVGNTKSAFNNYIYPWIKQYMNSGECDFSNASNTDTSTSLVAKEIVKTLQKALNSSYNCGLDEDGLCGSKTQSAIKSHILKKGIVNDHVKWLQEFLKIDADGSFGSQTEQFVKDFQKAKGLTVDGYAGLDTHMAIINSVEVVANESSNIYYRVITGSYIERSGAEKEREELKALGYNAFLVAFEKDGTTYLRVVAESLNNRTEADALVVKLKSQGYGAFISIYEK